MFDSAKGLHKTLYKSILDYDSTNPILMVVIGGNSYVLGHPLSFAMEENAIGQTREVTVDGYLVAYLLAILLSVGAIVIIFLFKRRSNQRRLIWLGILTSILFIVLMYFQVEEAKNTDGHNAHFKIGAMFPVLYIVFMALAYVGIRRDEKLIRSADRLR